MLSDEVKCYNQLITIFMVIRILCRVRVSVNIQDILVFELSGYCLRRTKTIKMLISSLKDTRNCILIFSATGNLNQNN